MVAGITLQYSISTLLSVGPTAVRRSAKLAQGVAERAKIIAGDVGASI